jgi:DNA-binding MarR family transcriptional regulator
MILQPDSVATFERLEESLRALTKVAPHCFSVRQMLTFIMIAKNDAMGKNLTLGMIRKESISEMDQNVERGIQTFYPTTKRDPNRLGWIDQVQDTEDLRRKFLVLSPQGRAIANEMTTALTEGVKSCSCN